MFYLRLKSFEKKKLKEFTPEIFAEMLSEAIDVAKLGLEIFGKLSTLETQINEQLKAFIERMKSFNALISWRDLVDLAQLYPVYTSEYWKEFVFEFHDLLAKAKLQEQVNAAHEYTLQNSAEWKKIRNQGSYFSGGGSYNDLKNSYQWTLRRLIKHKVLEEKTDSVLKVFPCFLEEIQRCGVAFKPSFAPSFNPAYIGHTSPVDKMMEWLENKVLGVATSVDSSLWYIRRELITPYVQEPESLEEGWYEIHYYVELTIRPIKFTEGSWSRSSNTIKLAEGIDGSKVQGSILKTIQEKHAEAMEVIMKMLVAQ